MFDSRYKGSWRIWRRVGHRWWRRRRTKASWLGFWNDSRPKCHSTTTSSTPARFSPFFSKMPMVNKQDIRSWNWKVLVDYQWVKIIINSLKERLMHFSCPPPSPQTIGGYSARQMAWIFYSASWRLSNDTTRAPRKKPKWWKISSMRFVAPCCSIPIALSFWR